jgi:hypothetical protein
MTVPSYGRRDDGVMTALAASAHPCAMATDDGIQVFVLEEFRLRADDADGAVARIAGEWREGREPATPLLTSIDDRRDVALLRALHTGELAEPDVAQHAALEPFVSSWQTPKHYGPRITERSESAPTYYRLAVTESGINDTGPVVEKPAGVREAAPSGDVGLLWIGQPVGTSAGLLVLLGSHDRPDATRPDAANWPLPLSRYLGVRIYESRI